jgi:leader peptidase (prepilin peptidase) / N-methyltransferase
VCIYRLPRSQSVSWPRSHCPSCGRPLAWYENVPVVELAAAARPLPHVRIGHQPMYPIVEALTGGLPRRIPDLRPTPLLGARLLFACAMIVLFAIDLRHQILPNVITLPGIVVGFALSLFLPPGWLPSLIGMVAGGGILFLIGEAYYRCAASRGWAWAT